LFDLEGLDEGIHFFSIILKNLKGPEKKYIFTFSYQTGEVIIEPINQKLE
jgi:hypothetical protein